MSLIVDSSNNPGVRERHQGTPILYKGLQPHTQQNFGSVL